MLGTLVAMAPDGLLYPARAFGSGPNAVGTAADFCAGFCGVAMCEYSGGSEDGTPDPCIGEPCPYEMSVYPCATVEITLDEPAALNKGTQLFAVVDPDHPESLAGNLSDVMASTAGDCLIGSVERPTSKYELDDDRNSVQVGLACPTVYARVGVDAKAGKPGALDAGQEKKVEAEEAEG